MVRDEVFKALEADRKAGKIGKALEARVSLAANQADYELLARYRDSLKELFNISQAAISGLTSESATEGTASDAVIETAPAEGRKCNRCWNYYADDSADRVRAFGPWNEVCGRCATALTQMGYQEVAQ